MNLETLKSCLDQFNRGQWSEQTLMQVVQAFHRLGTDDIPLPPKPRVRGAVWKGGGVKVFGYVGAIQAMTEAKVIDDLTHVGGSSGGSIFASLFALGFSGEQIVALAENLDMRDLTDVRHSPFGNYFASTKVGRVTGMLGSGYMYSGDHLRNFVAGLIEHALGDPLATFEDLHNARSKNKVLKDLYLVATRLKSQSGEPAEVVFGFDRYPKVLIVDAFCASLSLPLIYKPVMVRYKEGDTLKELGYFTDGGILNNFPITLFDEAKFCEPQYPLQSVRYNGVSNFAYNPSTVGFSLIADLGDLDPSLTPFTSRLQDLTAQKSSLSSDLAEGIHRWGNWDLFKAIYINAYGPRHPEDEKRKFQTHPEGIVQIYIEDVDMIEFDLKGEKFDRLLTSGREAFRLWYEHFHDPKATYTGTYSHHPVLSLQQRQQKANDYNQYLQGKMKESILDFMEELSRHEGTPLEELLQNARLRYNAYKIQSDYQKSLQRPEETGQSLQQAWVEASQTWKDQQAEQCSFRTHLKRYADKASCLKWLTTYVQTDDPASKAKLQQVIRAQTSRLCFYALKAKDNLLHTAAAKAPWNLPLLLDELRDYFDLCYQSGRLNSGDFISAINEWPCPPVLIKANEHHTLDAIVRCLEAGFDIKVRDKWGRTPIHDAIDKGSVEKLQVYLAYCRTHKLSVKDFNVGFDQKPLMFYILEHKDPNFIKRVFDFIEPEQLAWLVPKAIKDAAGNTIFETASRLPIQQWASVVERFHKDKLPLQFTACQKSYAAHQKAYAEKLDTLSDTVSSLPLDLEALKNVKAEELLALLNPVLAKSLWLTCMRQKDEAFTSQIFEKIHKAGLGWQLRALSHLPLQNKRLKEWAAELECPWMTELIKRWCKDRKLSPSPILIQRNLQRSAQVEQVVLTEAEVTELASELRRLTIGDS